MKASNVYESSPSSNHSEITTSVLATSSKMIANVPEDPQPSIRCMAYRAGCDIGTDRAGCDIRVLSRAFEFFDENGDGKLSIGEIRGFLAKLGLTMAQKELESMMIVVDKNSNGFVDLEEFLSLYRMLNCDEGRSGCIEEDDDENLKRAFRVFDKNKDGYISAQELQTVLANIGLAQGNNLTDCRNMIRGVDLDGDGQVNFMEFKVMMSPKCSRPPTIMSSNPFENNFSKIILPSSGKVPGKTG